MDKKKNILGINGSASKNSSNLLILRRIAELGKLDFDVEIIDDLSVLPHFKTVLTDEYTPNEIVEFRNKIANANGVIICTPEYVFSIPSGLKNAIEWCVSTVVFSDKPVGLITASANGEKGHEELKLIMKTIQAKFIDRTALLIRGVKGKVNKNKQIIEDKTDNELREFTRCFKELIDK